MRTPVLLVGLALAACGCKGEPAPAAPASNVFIAVTGPGEGQRPPPGFEGLWIDIVPGVEYRYRSVTGIGPKEQRETRLNGHPFVVEDEYVVIGPLRCGPLAQGTHIEIRNEGVFAQGKLLGPLPERIPMPADWK